MVMPTSFGGTDLAAAVAVGDAVAVDDVLV